MKTKKQKQQLMLYPPVDLVKDADAAVKRLGISRTRNSILVEILETYLPQWVAAEQAKRQIVTRKRPATPDL